MHVIKIFDEYGTFRAERVFQVYDEYAHRWAMEQVRAYDGYYVYLRQEPRILRRA